jgi:serralysin
MISIDGDLFWDDKVTNTHRRMQCAAPDKETMTVATLLKPLINLNGDLSDWVASERIDYGDVAGYSLYAQPQGDFFYFALNSPVVIGANTTFWFNTDLDATTGFQIFAATVAIGGAEYNLNINADGITASLYTGAAGETLVLANIQIAYSSDSHSIEFAIPTAALGNPGAIDVLYDVNNTIFGPTDYTLQPYVAYANNGVTRVDPSMRIGIVYSDTTAANYFSATAYSDLIMAAENQAIQAGIPFDLLNEADLTDLAKLANYDALVFPSFTNVQSGDVAAITNTLLQATKQFGIGLITSGEFMTNDETGLALAGDPYARMKMFFDATRADGGTGDVTINSSDTNQLVFKDTAPGALIQTYVGVGWNTYTSVSGTGQTIATETVGGLTHAAALATQTTGGRNVLFSSNGVMADSNLLGQAIEYVAKAPGVSLSLDMSRFNGLFATRMDMDQSQFPLDVSPVVLDANDNPVPVPGIYDILLPILQQWNTQYNFTGSYYVNIGDNPNGVTESTTDWAKSLTYYHAIEALGGEIGTHSYTHVITPPTTTFTAHTVGVTPAGSVQVTLDQLPAFYGITVGMVVSGLNIGEGAQLPPVGGESGAVVNTMVTAVSGNTITLSFVPGGYGTLNNGVLGDIPAGTTLTFNVPAENTNFLETATNGPTSSTGNPFTYEYEFNQAKALLELQLGHQIYGAAIPGAAETYATAANIFPYFQSGIGYTGYVTGGWTGIGAGYPGAIGFMSPYDQGSVYIAPNMTFDFTEIQYQGKSIADAELDWLAQFNANAANSAGTPIDVLPIHDYGAAAWNTTNNTSTGSPYATDATAGNMYTYIIQHAHDAGYEFVTLEDLAYRYQSFANTAVTSTVNGNVISVSVASAHAGDFALDVAGQGTQVIANVGNWYAYDSNSLFLPETGGNFTVTLGAAADDVTHITALPMRGDLLSVTGDGLNLSFSMFGDGDVLIDLGQFGTKTAVVTGATIKSLVGDQLNITLTGLGAHDVTLQMVAAPPAPTNLALAAGSDSGVSSTDNITNVTAPTFTGTAQAGSTVTLLEGTTVIGTGVATATGAWTITSSTLTNGTHGIAAKASVSGVYSPVSAALSVTIDTVAPAVPSAPDLITASDSGSSSTDNITNIATPTFTGTAEAGSLVKLFDGTTLVGSATATSTGSFSAVSSKLSDGAQNFTATATDVAGNVSAASGSLTVTIDTKAPNAPAFTGLVAANGNNLTLSGTGEAGTTVAVLNGTTLLGSPAVGTLGTWNMTFSLGNNKAITTLTATDTDTAGNKSPTSGSALVGTSGANALTSTTGNELFYGGGGVDTFSFASLFGRDIIADFTPGGGSHDIINFHAISALNTFDNVLNHTVQAGSGVVISQDASNTLTLNNVTKASLVTADFTFA